MFNKISSTLWCHDNSDNALIKPAGNYVEGDFDESSQCN